MNRRQAVIKRKTKSVDDKGSFEKLVAGAMVAMMASWMVEKSSMLFCKSRMLRKKSLDMLETGFMVRGGARGGPEIEYVEALWLRTGEGGGGWRER